MVEDEGDVWEGAYEVGEVGREENKGRMDRKKDEEVGEEDSREGAEEGDKENGEVREGCGVWVDIDGSGDGYGRGDRGGEGRKGWERE